MASRTKKPVKTTTSKAKAKAKKPLPRTSSATRTAKAAAKKKMMARKPTAKQTVKLKPTAKPVAKKKTPRKAAPIQKPAASRQTLTTLREHVDAVEARLKRANSLTKSSVKAMQTAFTRLNERSGQASAAQEKEIVEYVEALNVHLTSLIEKTREDVAHDLQIVLEDPRVQTITDALTKANQRITRAESEQAAALTSINEQIANLATVVDRRLRRESEERAQAQHLLTQKIETVEKSSADAVSGIGEKIVALTEELTNRTEDRIAAVKREISESSYNPRNDIEHHKSEVDRRIEALEDDQRNTIPSIERRLVTIVSRLESLETDHFAAANVAQSPAPSYEPAQPYETAPTNLAPAVGTDAFAPQPATAYESVPQPAQSLQLQSPQPATMPAAVQEPIAVAPEPEAVPVLTTEPMASHIPQEYIPQEYIPQEYVPPTYPEQEYTAPESILAQTPAPDAYSASPYDQIQPQMTAEPSLQSGELPPPPFDSEIPLMPAPEQTMDEARPGGDIIPEKKRGFLKMLKGGASKSAVSGSPVKLFALMTGIAVIGLFAAQKIMPGPPPSSSENEIPRIVSTEPAPVERVDNPAFAVAEPTPPVIESMDVVGDYSDTMQAPELEPESNGEPSPAQLTLESAAAKGDMVAQFQLGLANLEAGRNAEAVRLIRLSANQGQPAAQYRLAKLYENGIGVEQDLPTAMKLLERSAKGGNRIAMHDLGHYFATGASSTQPEIEKAVTWFQQAAERGVLDSQFNLGVLYQEGSGVSKNLVDSYVWYAVAGAQGDQMAVQRAEILTREMSALQIEQAKTRVKAFVPTRINDAANGVFKNLPWARPAQSRTARVNPEVKQAQELLANLGYEVGTPDGAMGPKTRSAIVEFEKSNGLPETGRVSAELMDRLSLAAGV